MPTVLIAFAVLATAFVVGISILNVLIRNRAQAMNGQPLPDLPGDVGAGIRGADRGLVYFFSPRCGACKSVTPRMRALREKNRNVFLIDISQSLDIARALRVMATPSVLEVANGQIVQMHIGHPPNEVMRRFA